MDELKKYSGQLTPTDSMPLLFLGHGSPMNAIEENEFTNGWREIGATLPKPQAILCISAHWETIGTQVTAMEAPRTIHDFYGFPRELFGVSYPAPGSPALAEATRRGVQKTIVELDTKWGLDHGCWSVAKHLFPDANIPVIQLSLDRRQSPLWHYELAGELAFLRRKGVLILGSGNIVHNLGIMDWENSDDGYDWAREANDLLKHLILEGDHTRLAGYQALGEEIRLSVPTPEHFLPLLYVLALKDEKEGIGFFNDKTIFGSISMTSLKIGR